MDLISKKDLLAVTGISYGQLYRWKRERLIPEDWFIKRSSYTGQETFFPRQQILSRVQTILEAKDRYSLEELAHILSPESSAAGFRSAEGVQSMEEIGELLKPVIDRLYGKSSYEFAEILVFCAVSQIVDLLELSEAAAEELLGMAMGAARGVQDLTDMTMTVFRTEGTLHLALNKTAAPLVLDKTLVTCGACDLGALAGKLKLKYHY